MNDISVRSFTTFSYILSFRKDLGPYRTIIYGSCSSHGMKPITTFQECNNAAKALGLEAVTASEKASGHYPEGCFRHGPYLWLSTNPANKGNGADHRNKPICKLAG